MEMQIVDDNGDKDCGMGFNDYDLGLYLMTKEMGFNDDEIKRFELYLRTRWD
jgi:hypothetical protein